MPQVASAEIVLRATGEADVQRGLQNVEKALNETSKATRTTGSSMDDLGKAAAGAIAAFGVSGVINLTSSLVQLGASADAARGALSAMSGMRTDEFIGAIGTATNGTISELEAAQIAAKLLGMQIVNTSSEAAEFTRVAAILGAQFKGLGAREAADEFAIMLANMSTLRLDSFGISSAAVKAEMDRLKATIPGITDEMAFYQATMSQAVPMADQLSGALTNQQSSVQRMNAHWENFKATVGTALADGLLPLVDAIIMVADSFKPLMLAGGEVVNIFTLAQASFAAWTDTATQMIQGNLSLGGALEYVNRRAELNAFAMGAITTAHVDAATAIENDGEMMRRLGANSVILSEGVERQTISVEEAQKAFDEWKTAMQGAYRQQSALANVVGDFDGQIGNLGVTVLRTVGAHADLGEASAMLREQIASTSDDLHEAQVAAIAMGDDGTGPLGAQINELSGYLGHLQNRLNDVSGAAGGTTSAMTIMSLTQEELQQVGSSFLDFVRATGGEAALAGGAFDELRLRYGLVDEAQITMEHGLQTLGTSLSNNNITAQQAADIYEQLVTGQLASADAAVAQAEAINGIATAFGLSTEKAQGFLESAAQSYGIDPYAGLSVSAEDAVNPSQALSDRTSEIQQNLQQIAAVANPAMTAMSESAPAAIEAISRLANRTDATKLNFQWFLTNSAAVFDAMNAAASTAVSEGAGLALANTMIAQMRAAWSYLLANPRLSLQVYLSTIGSVSQSTAAASGSGGGATITGGAGGTFMTSGPTHLTVGDNPGGVELVTVAPLSGVGSTHVTGNAAQMAGGGALFAGGGGGGGTTNNVTITVLAQSFDDIVREASARGYQFQAVA